MKNTKDKIIEKSRHLFNTFGYSQVTIRMIASELKMSSGNLNYHFKKREDILEALYFEMVEVFDKRVEVLEDQVISLEFMQSNIKISMKRMVEYRFFWTDLYNLLRSNVKIKNHFEAVKNDRIKGYLFVFEYFLNHGILKKESFRKEHLLLIEKMIDYSNTWLYASILYGNNRNTSEIINHASFHLLLMMYPYLTTSGKREFRNLHSYNFESSL